MYQGDVDVVSVSSGQVDTLGDVAMSAIQTSLVTDPSVTLAHKVGPGLQDLQKRG